MYGLPLSRSINDFPWGLVCAREMDGCERVRGKVGVRKTGGSIWLSFPARSKHHLWWTVVIWFRLEIKREVSEIKDQSPFDRARGMIVRASFQMQDEQGKGTTWSLSNGHCCMWIVLAFGISLSKQPDTVGRKSFKRMYADLVSRFYEIMLVLYHSFRNCPASLVHRDKFYYSRGQLSCLRLIFLGFNAPLCILKICRNGSLWMDNHYCLVIVDVATLFYADDLLGGHPYHK
ncbi:hypothetical protein V6N13_064150 [Hibiscus sabdariffa]